MTNQIAHRYLSTYREDEARLICSRLLSGKSLGFVGLAGIGKSNLVNFLREGGLYAAGYVDWQATPAFFPVLHANSWTGTPSGLWQLMILGLSQAKGAPPAPDERVVSLDGEARSLQRLQNWVAKICQEMGQRVMFILDDFDGVLERGPLAMLEQLSTLRSEGNRDMLSYLMMTRGLPHVLGRSYDLEGRSKFYDLFREDIYALEPHTTSDALHLLAHLNKAARQPFRTTDLFPIYQLAGGHAQLLTTIFAIWAERGPQLPINSESIARICEHPDIRAACTRILLGMHEDEQETALCLARGQKAPGDEAIISHLMRRGLLTHSSPITWFSPVMGRFLSEFRTQGG
jgi:hypothetical protein